MKVAIYPGSFDPVTNGHLDIIKRAAAIFDEVVVAIFVNSAKKSAFTVEERVLMLKTVTKDIPNVKVISSDKLLVNYMEENNIKVIVKGLRMISDFEFEFQMALTNREQSPDIETLFMMTATMAECGGLCYITMDIWACVIMSLAILKTHLKTSEK